MNKSNVLKIACAIEEINKLAGESLSLYSHTGSMGHTYETLKVEVVAKDGIVLFSGLPECVGYEDRSNYAYQAPNIKPPAESIFRWVKGAFCDAHYFTIDLHTVADWEGSDRIETTTTASYPLSCYACASVMEATMVAVQEGKDYRREEKTIIGDECSFVTHTDYESEEDEE